MARRVDSLNESFAKKLGAVDSGELRRVQNAALALEDYKKKMEQGKVLKVNFTAFGQSGLSLVDEAGVLVLLPSEVKDVDEENRRRFTPMRNSLDYTIEVTVKSIDEETNTVIVAAVGDNGNHVSQSVIVRNELSKEIHAGRRPLVYGRVGSISPEGDRAIVNLYGMSIVGFINVRNWQNGYTRNLHSVCNVGDYYPFEVVRFAPKVAGKEAAFILDRTNVAGDPWKNPTIRDLSVGDTLMVTCVEIPAGKSYWWGRSPRVPGLELMGDFTRKFPSGTGIVPGLTYKCNIRDLEISDSPEKRSRFQVYPVDISVQDAPSLQNLRNKINLEEAIKRDEQE